MNKEAPVPCANRMQFIVAAMTKDYDKARGIANTILDAEPGDTTLHDYLSILERESNKRKRIRDDINDSESDSELSVSSSSDSSNSNSDSSTDSGDSTWNIIENKNTRDFIELEKKCNKFGTKDLAFDCSKEKRTPQVPSDRHNYVEINKVTLGDTDFRGKMIRVLPIRLSEKINKIN